MCNALTIGISNRSFCGEDNLIDKLKLSTSAVVNQTVISNLLTNKAMVTVVDNNYKLKVVDKSVGLSIGIGNRYNGNNIVELNPARYSNYLAMLIDIGGYFPNFNTDDFRIRRIDFAVDIPERLQDVYESYLVKNYRKGGMYFGYGKVETIYYGKYPKVTVFYHDADKHNEATTRIEVRYFSNKVPDCLKVLTDLPNAITLSPFEGLTPIVITSAIPDSPAEIIKYYGIKSMLSQFGYSETRKKLNIGGNFKRYSCFFTEKICTYQPWELELPVLISFFCKGGDDNHA